MRNRFLVAFLLGTVLFTLLPYFAYPVAVEGDWGDQAFRSEANRIFLLGFGGAAVIGAVLVLITRNAWGVALGFLCPLVGSLLYVALLVEHPEVVGVDLVAVLITFVQFFPLALVGAGFAMLMRILFTSVYRRQ